MKYTKVVDYREIKEKYDYIIGWGTGPLFEMNYTCICEDFFCIIDGTNGDVGGKKFGITIRNKECLGELDGKILVIVYAIYEREILEQISAIRGDIDTVMYSLLQIENEKALIPRINGKSAEDYILITLLRQMHLKTVKYLEIGVCHPVLRNNTYLLYETYSNEEGFEGVLVEANPTCWELIDEYRPKDKLIKCGVGKEEKVATFYMFPSYLGHSTFVKETADELIKENRICEKYQIPMRNINCIIEEEFDGTPDLLSLDVEGLDYEVLASWDEKKYPISIVLTEVTECGENNIAILMERKGYRCVATTMENVIWMRTEIELFY